MGKVQASTDVGGKLHDTPEGPELGLVAPEESIPSDVSYPSSLNVDKDNVVSLNSGAATFAT